MTCRRTMGSLLTGVWLAAACGPGGEGTTADGSEGTSGATAVTTDAPTGPATGPASGPDPTVSTTVASDGSGDGDPTSDDGPDATTDAASTGTDPTAGMSETGHDTGGTEDATGSSGAPGEGGSTGPLDEFACGYWAGACSICVQQQCHAALTACEGEGSCCCYAFCVASGTAAELCLLECGSDVTDDVAAALLDCRAAQCPPPECP